MIVLVTLEIKSGLSQTYLQFAFDAVPTTADIADQLGEDAFKGLLDCCEVEEIADYANDFDVDGILLLDCVSEDTGKSVGSITLERKEVLVATGVEIS